MARILQMILTLVAILLVSAAQGALILAPGGLGVYDTELDITWTRDANINGLASWDDQIDWVDQFTLGGHGNWRLASVDIDQNEIPINCSISSELACRQDNEMGYMYHFNGVTPAFPGVFTNLATGALFNHYWSAEDTTGVATVAWRLNFADSLGIGNDGFVSSNEKFALHKAWAVADGNVFGAVIPPVPIPGTLWLFGSALGILGWLSRSI